jgi:hypothetical protein
LLLAARDALLLGGGVTREQGLDFRLHQKPATPVGANSIQQADFILA